MIFSPDLCELILAGKKTVTRRLVVHWNPDNQWYRAWSQTFDKYRAQVEQLVGKV